MDTTRLAHLHGGPRHGEWIAARANTLEVIRPEPLTWAAHDPGPIAPDFVTGRYTPAPWTNDPHRWDWQGWSDERHTPDLEEQIQHIREYVVTIELPPATRHTVLPGDYTSPDAMRLDATTQAAQDEISAWHIILHPQRQRDETG